MKINNKIVQFERQFDPYKVRVLPEQKIALCTFHDSKIVVHYTVLLENSVPKLRCGVGFSWNYPTTMVKEFLNLAEKMLIQFRTELTKGEAKNGTP